MKKGKRLILFQLLLNQKTANPEELHLLPNRCLEYGSPGLKLFKPKILSKLSWKSKRVSSQVRKRTRCSNLKKNTKTTPEIRDRKIVQFGRISLTSLLSPKNGRDVYKFHIFSSKSVLLHFYSR